MGWEQWWAESEAWEDAQWERWWSEQQSFDGGWRDKQESWEKKRTWMDDIADQVESEQVAEAEKASQMTVTVPAGMGPGGVFEVMTPEYRMLRIEVPAGLKAGDSFNVSTKPN